MALNRLIELQARTVKRDQYGSEVGLWGKLVSVWAEKLSVKPAERFVKTSARTVNTSTTQFKILAREDVNEVMRVIDDNGVTWNILGIIKNDRTYLTLQVGHLP